MSLRLQSHPDPQTQYCTIAVHRLGTCGCCTDRRQMDGLIRHLVGQSVADRGRRLEADKKSKRNDGVTTRPIDTLCSPHACWDCGFEFHGGLGCFSTVSVMCCQVEVSATSWSFVQRIVVRCCVWSRNLVNVVAISSQVGYHLSGQGFQTSSGKGLQPLLQAGSLAARVEIAIWYTFTRNT